MPKVRLVIFFLLFLVILNVIGVSKIVNNRYYKGPVTDHFDGKKFHMPEYPAGGHKTLFDVLKWRLMTKRTPWPEWVDYTQTKPLPAVEGADLKTTFINHSTVLIQTQGVNILTDPIYSKRASPLTWVGPKRVHHPGVAFEDLPKIDVIIISHDHYDHCDVDTIERLWKRDKPIILCGLGVDKIIQLHNPDIAAHAMDWWQSVEIAPHLKAHFVPVQHWCARGILDRNHALWGGYVLESPHGNVFFGGDTGYTEKYFTQIQQRFKEFRLALLPIGAYLPIWFMKFAHMSPFDAVKTHKLLNAQYSLAIHHRTFNLADDAYDQPYDDLIKALGTEAVSKGLFKALKPGEAWDVPNE